MERTVGRVGDRRTFASQGMQIRDLMTLRGAGNAVLLAAMAASLFGQAATPRLLSAAGNFPQANGIRKALSGYLDQAGHERRVLSGTVTQGGAVAPFTFTREMDQNVRIDFGGPSARGLVVTGLHTPGSPKSAVSGSAVQAADYDVLETLAEDTPEAFLYGFGTAAQMRWLGDGYQINDTTNPDYAGHSYGIYAVGSPSGIQPGAPRRSRSFLFDLKTQLLSETRYQIEKNGATVSVVVKFSGWTTISGQVTPTTIVRSENGVTTLSISINSAASVATQADSLFTI